MYYTAIVLAAGQGSRMNSKIRKQYMQIGGKPVLYYALRAFEDSFADEIILVTAEEEIAFCKKEIVGKYAFQKVTKIVAGGAERYHSVYRGLCAARAEGCVLIHDGARPFLSKEILERARETLHGHAACAAAVRAKDTVKIADADGYVIETPDRASVWNMQTPQCFTYELAMGAYRKLMASVDASSGGGKKCGDASSGGQQESAHATVGEEQKSGSLSLGGKTPDRGEPQAQPVKITDDAMVIEHFSSERVRLFEGAYGNIKITTPEDMILAEAYLKRIQEK